MLACFSIRSIAAVSRVLTIGGVACGREDASVSLLLLLLVQMMHMVLLFVQSLESFVGFVG